MAGEAQETNWPLPKFHFEVVISNVGTVAFQEVSGLDLENQLPEYRAGTRPAVSPVKRPGIQKTGNVTLKRGIFARDDKFFEWYQSINRNTVRRGTVTIKLLDERGSPTMTWTLSNAMPVRITGADLNADGNEVAIESLELAHEGLVIANS